MNLTVDCIFKEGVKEVEEEGIDCGTSRLVLRLLLLFEEEGLVLIS